MIISSLKKYKDWWFEGTSIDLSIFVSRLTSLGSTADDVDVYQKCTTRSIQLLQTWSFILTISCFPSHSHVCCTERRVTALYSQRTALWGRYDRLPPLKAVNVSSPFIGVGINVLLLHFMLPFTPSMNTLSSVPSGKVAVHVSLSAVVVPVNSAHGMTEFSIHNRPIPSSYDRSLELFSSYIPCPFL